MSERQPAGSVELEHTADWKLLVWAPDLPTLFAEAALGMSRLSGIRIASKPRQERKIHLDAGDDESLLVSFLSELLYWGEEDGVAFDEFDLRSEVQIH